MSDEDSFFSVVNHECRRRLLILLLGTGELCVCDLVSATGVPQAVVSRHLAMARDARLVVARRQGTWMYYRLHSDLAPWVGTILAAISRGPNRETYARDAQRLKALPHRAAPCGVQP